jgi:hypothetical protein
VKVSGRKSKIVSKFFASSRSGSIAPRNCPMVQAASHAPLFLPTYRIQNRLLCIARPPVSIRKHVLHHALLHSGHRCTRSSRAPAVWFARRFYRRLCRDPSHGLHLSFSHTSCICSRPTCVQINIP